MTKPKPLDLEEIDKKILDKFKRLEESKRTKYEKMTPDEQWDYLANLIRKHRENEINLFTSSYERLINLTLDEIKQQIEKAKKEFIKELEDAFDHADVDDTIWYDDVATLYEEIVIRFERIFGEVRENE
ncbi:MAG: hypothetical protein ACP6IY_18900 [Promethearchaeia archaeon]